MNNLYRKVAVASVCTALGFVLGASPEAKAATITLETRGFDAADRNRDGLGDTTFDYAPLFPPILLGVISGRYTETVEFRPLYEFNIANLSLPSNTIVTHAIFQVRRMGPFSFIRPDAQVNLFGYKGNGKMDESDFQAGTYLTNSEVLDFFRFDVTPFVNVVVNNNDAFAGFGLRAERFNGNVDNKASLIIETADVAVPEPTTIFGSALALSLGGWLKRKKSSQQNKTMPQP
jgi:hypothetical protein